MDIADGSIVWSDIMGTSASMNMPTQPALIDIDYDNYHDLAYMGDQEGGLWRIDLRDDPFTVTKLFETPGQPITAQPVLTTNEMGDVMVFFRHRPLHAAGRSGRRFRSTLLRRDR